MYATPRYDSQHTENSHQRASRVLLWLLCYPNSRFTDTVAQQSLATQPHITTHCTALQDTYRGIVWPSR
jgi:hypothetical protein